MTRIILSIATLLFSYSAFAGWPEFNVVNPETIVNELAVKGDCPNDEMKIPQGTQVQIQSRYIPSDEKWYWVYEGSNECVKFPQQLKYIAYQLTGNQDIGGQIITDYGDTQGSLFKFIFTYKPSWDCGAFVGTNPPERFGCAQDM